MTPSTPAGPPGAPETRRAWRSVLGSVALDVAPSLLIFFVLHALGVADVIAYLAGSVVPLGRLLVDRWRGRPFNALSALVVVFLLVSVALAVVTDDARAVIARGGVIYLAIALYAAISVPTRSPLMLLLSRYVTARSHPETTARFDALYRRPPALRAMRRVTGAWALGFGVAAVACVVCAYTLPITVAATATSLIEPVIALVLAAGTARYLRRVTASLAPTTPEADAPTVQFRSAARHPAP